MPPRSWNGLRTGMDEWIDERILAVLPRFDQQDHVANRHTRRDMVSGQAVVDRHVDLQAIADQLCLHRELNRIVQIGCGGSLDRV